MKPDEVIPFELQLMSDASGYQENVLNLVRPFIGNRVLEVGAGIGNLSVRLPLREKLIFSEADDKLIAHLRMRAEQEFSNDPRVQVRKIDLESDWSTSFESDNLDTVISFNVLEHVRDDGLALRQMIKLLRVSTAKQPKRVVVFVPAHQWAFGEIDQSFGHYRRYSVRPVSRLLRELSPHLKVEYQYFNLLGLIGWFCKGKLFRSKNIGPGTVRIYERILPLVSAIDFIAYKILKIPAGQSLLFVISLND